MIIYYSTDIQGDQIVLSKEDHRHCGKVTRKRVGDNVYVTDGKGGFYHCTISAQDKMSTTVKILDRTQQQKRSYSVHLAVAPTKLPARIEWMVEKCIEIGVDSIYFIETHRGERSKLKLERLHRIAISALKQSKNLYLPTIYEMASLDAVVALHPAADIYVAHCGDIRQHLGRYIQGNTNTDTLLFIGPEGDFTEEEIISIKKKGGVEVNLGRSRLRTETAGVVACSIVATVYDSILTID